MSLLRKAKAGLEAICKGSNTSALVLFIEFIKRAGEKRLNTRIAEHFKMSMIVCILTFISKINATFKRFEAK